jgi:hypothetical protein
LLFLGVSLIPAPIPAFLAIANASGRTAANAKLLEKLVLAVFSTHSEPGRTHIAIIDQEKHAGRKLLSFGRNFAARRGFGGYIAPISAFC